MIVKYEDLHTNTESEMRKILPFLDLDAGQYDFQRALNLPVVGSSTFKRTEEKVKWLPVMKTDDFNPLTRADEWPRSMHERFNWLAGKQLEQLGYAKKIFAGDEQFWSDWNTAEDAKWAVNAKPIKSDDAPGNPD